MLTTPSQEEKEEAWQKEEEGRGEAAVNSAAGATG
jgi:hypothetical protein